MSKQDNNLVVAEKLGKLLGSVEKVDLHHEVIRARVLTEISIGEWPPMSDEKSIEVCRLLDVARIELDNVIKTFNILNVRLNLMK